MNRHSAVYCMTDSDVRAAESKGYALLLCDENYFVPGFFMRLVWLAAHRHCPSKEIQVSVKRP